MVLNENIEMCLLFYTEPVLEKIRLGKVLWEGSGSWPFNQIQKQQINDCLFQSKLLYMKNLYITFNNLH